MEFCSWRQAGMVMVLLSSLRLTGLWLEVFIYEIYDKKQIMFYEMFCCLVCYSNYF